MEDSHMTGVMHPYKSKNKDWQQTPETGKGKGGSSSFSLQKGSMALLTLDFRFLASRTEEEYISVG